MSPRTDEGFSLVEVVLAMFLLAILSLAVLPALIGGITMSTVNKDVVAATAFANARIASLRAEFSSEPGSTSVCENLLARMLPTEAANEDIGTGMKATFTVLDPCPTSPDVYPVTVRARIAVAGSGGKLLVTADTSFRVSEHG